MAQLGFFDRLGIGVTADIRTIKRAYARTLKEIDQQAQREAFEQLRAAYEEALAWARRHADDGSAETSAGVASPGPGARERNDASGDSSDAAARGVLAFSDGGVAPAAETDAVDPECDDFDPDPEDGADDDAERADDADGTRDDANPTWTAIQHWIDRLMKAGETDVRPLLDQALGDPRLWHLDGRQQFETRLIAALRRDPLGRAALFEQASRHFGWPARRAAAHRSHPQDVWVSRVIDQGLLWESLPGPTRTRLAAAMKAALATGTPTCRQAFRHRPALQELRGDFLEWSALFLAPARLDVWQQAFDDMPADARRRLRIERALLGIVAGGWRVVMAIFRFLRDNIFDTWPYRVIGGFLLVSFIATWLAGGFEGDHRSAAQQATANVMRIALANAQRVGAYPPRAAGQAAPVPLAALPGELDRRSCRTTHAALHTRDARIFEDPELIASLGTHAMLCTVNYHWPAMADPIVRCLEEESWSASHQRRPQDNAHCAQAQARR